MALKPQSKSDLQVEFVIRRSFARLTGCGYLPSFRATRQNQASRQPCRTPEPFLMKVRNSLKSLRGRHRNNRLVRRKGRLYVINKTQRRFKARQG